LRIPPPERIEALDTDRFQPRHRRDFQHQLIARAPSDTTPGEAVRMFRHVVEQSCRLRNTGAEAFRNVRIDTATPRAA